jgi:hypothetical protein
MGQATEKPEPTVAVCPRLWQAGRLPSARAVFDGLHAVRPAQAQVYIREPGVVSLEGTVCSL